MAFSYESHTHCLNKKMSNRTFCIVRCAGMWPEEVSCDLFRKSLSIVQWSQDSAEFKRKPVKCIQQKIDVIRWGVWAGCDYNMQNSQTQWDWSPAHLTVKCATIQVRYDTCMAWVETSHYLSQRGRKRRSAESFSYVTCQTYVQARGNCRCQ